MKKGSLIDRNENIWNVPNLLTMLRMAAVVVFIVLFARGKKNAAMIVFILAAVTDVLDGYIARRFHLITSFGKLMDPLADKLMTLSALVCLTVTGYVPLWLVIIEGAKDKREALRSLRRLRGLSVEEVAYVGDDLNDLPAFAESGLTFAPNDAAEDVYDAADIGLDNPGGRGAVREAIEYILAAQDKWEKIVASYEQAGQGDRQ